MPVTAKFNTTGLLTVAPSRGVTKTTAASGTDGVRVIAGGALGGGVAAEVSSAGSLSGCPQAASHSAAAIVKIPMLDFLVTCLLPLAAQPASDRCQG